MQKMRSLIALWLTIAATGVWADTVDSITVEGQAVEEIPDQVKMRDGSVVTDCPHGHLARTTPILIKV